MPAPAGRVDGPPTSVALWYAHMIKTGKGPVKRHNLGKRPRTAHRERPRATIDQMTGLVREMDCKRPRYRDVIAPNGRHSGAHAFS